MQYTILLELKLTKQELRAEILLVEQMSRDRPRPIAKEGRKVRKRALSEELAREQPAAPECWPLQPPLALPTPSMYYQPLRRVYVQAGRYFCTSALQWLCVPSVLAHFVRLDVWDQPQGVAHKPPALMIWRAMDNTEVQVSAKTGVAKLLCLTAEGEMRCQPYESVSAGIR